MESREEDITALLESYREGDEAALGRVVPLLYAELRRMAARYLAGERTNHTLGPTALVHEAYLRLAGQRDGKWENRSHFLACAALAMRHILVDHARRHRSEKRGSGHQSVPLEETHLVASWFDENIIALDDALSRLQSLSQEQAKVVELKFFGGLTNEETAEALGISEASVRRDWTVARAWLRRDMTRGGLS